MLASSLRFLDDDYYLTRKQEAIVAYASNSWSYIVKVWFAADNEPGLHVCQAVCLLSVIDFIGMFPRTTTVLSLLTADEPDGRRHPGWMKIGLSIRLAQDLQLMLEPDSELSFVEQEERRRVFWSIYLLDKLCSCGRARPAAIPDAHCQVQLPGTEEDFLNGVWKKTPTLKQALSASTQGDERPSNAALVVAVASIIGKCAQHMIHEHGKTEGYLPPWDSKSDFAMIHSTLLRIETQFEIGASIEDALVAQHGYPRNLKMQTVGPIIFSYALFYTAHCLLNHPFLLYQQCKFRSARPPASFLNRAMHGGRENACLMAKLIVDSEALGYSIYYSFVGYCATVSASIHTMYLNDSNAEYRLQAQQSLAGERKYLEKYALAWKTGHNMVIVTFLAHDIATADCHVPATYPRQTKLTIPPHPRSCIRIPAVRAPRSRRGVGTLGICRLHRHDAETHSSITSKQQQCGDDDDSDLGWHARCKHGSQLDE